MGKDPRTIIRAITAGQIRGGAEPRPQRLRWYVYADQLPPELQHLAQGLEETPPAED